MKINEEYWEQHSDQYNPVISGSRWAYSEADRKKLKPVCPNYEKIGYATRKKGALKVGVRDPAVADTGTKCGDGKMCWPYLNQKYEKNGNHRYFLLSLLL